LPFFSSTYSCIGSRWAGAALTIDSRVCDSAPPRMTMQEYKIWQAQKKQREQQEFEQHDEL